MVKELKLALFILIIAIFGSCNSKSIYYSYEDVTITRIDQGRKTYLFYGKCKDDCFQKNECVKIEYPGFSNSLDCFLIFKPDKRVALVSVMGYCIFPNHSNRMLVLEDYDSLRIDTVRKGNYPFNNMIRLSDNPDFEKENILKDKTNVILKLSP